MIQAFPAHILSSKNTGEPEDIIQTVPRHCLEAAEIAAKALAPMGLTYSAYLAGLLHDCGKLTLEYKSYLIRASHGEPVRKGFVNHTFAGVRLLLDRYHSPTPERYEDIVCELLAYAIGAHHGLFDCVDEHKKSGFSHRMEKEGVCSQEAIQNFLALCKSQEELDTLFQKAVAEISPIFDRLQNLTDDAQEMAFYVGLLARMLLSAVVEGDRRNTAEFMNNMVYPQPPPNLRNTWQVCLERVEAKLSSLPAETAIQQARRTISETCKNAAQKPGGIYRLNVPTGAGKTLSSLRYALAHAAKWEKSRIIFIMPLLTIIEQNAAEIRSYIQDDTLILEHHSNMVQTETGNDLDTRELLTENWATPIVITTLVQMLNTLFSGKMPAVRRFQALCNSIIVFDEVQTVPVRMLSLFNLAVNFLSEVCGATIVLCSATQPCLERTEHPLYKEPEEIVPFRSELWNAFQRTTLQDTGNYRLDEIPSFAEHILEEANSLLIICNKKTEAETLYRALRHKAACFHLSAAMCPAHRRETLKKIEEALPHQKVICVSTQVIEAGVNISFQRVIRLLAGMDNVVQAAGRCNRHGESPNIEPVYVISCVDEDLSRLQDIQKAQQAAQELLAEYRCRPDDFQNDLASDAAIRYYYQRLYNGAPQDFPIPKTRLTLYHLLSSNPDYADTESDGWGHYYLSQAFQTAGAHFSVFEQNTTTVIAPYGKGRELTTLLHTERAQKDNSYAAALLKEAKPYAVSLFEYQIRWLTQEKALIPLGDCGALELMQGYYDEETGVITNQHDFGQRRCEFCDTLIL